MSVHYESLGKQRAQRGAVLMTALVLLAVMTIIGVATMKFANLDERMAINASLQSQALRAAEGSVAAAPQFVNKFAGLIGSSGSETETPTVGSNMVGSLTFTYRGETIASGGGYSIGTMGFYHFDSTATGTAVAPDGAALASQNIRAGIRILGPASM